MLLSFVIGILLTRSLVGPLRASSASHAGLDRDIDLREAHFDTRSGDDSHTRSHRRSIDAERAALLRSRRRSGSGARSSGERARPGAAGRREGIPRPAAPAFLSASARDGVTRTTSSAPHPCPRRTARLAASKVMDNKKASEFAQALAQQGRTAEAKVPNDHRLASDAAASSSRAAVFVRPKRPIGPSWRAGDVDSYSASRERSSRSRAGRRALTLREGARRSRRERSRQRGGLARCCGRARALRPRGAPPARGCPRESGRPDQRVRGIRALHRRLAFPA